MDTTILALGLIGQMKSLAGGTAVDGISCFSCHLHLLQKFVHWSSILTSRLTDKVKLVGSTISCEGTFLHGNLTAERRQNPHVQSYMMATDQVILVDVSSCQAQVAWHVTACSRQAQAQGTGFVSSCMLCSSDIHILDMVLNAAAQDAIGMTVQVSMWHLLGSWQPDFVLGAIPEQEV